MKTFDQLVRRGTRLMIVDVVDSVRMGISGRHRDGGVHRGRVRGILRGVYPTQAGAIEAASAFVSAEADEGTDVLYAAAQGLAGLAADHADAVERRGDEIDALLAQIRSIVAAASP